MERARRRVATFEAAPNIALVKYWGMRDVERSLPFNSSISFTVDRFRTRTTVEFDPAGTRDRFFLNGREEGGPARDDVVRFLDRVRELSGLSDRARVFSVNSFPTASGLASSASGFAALAGAASRAAGVTLSSRALTRLPRLGSGSATRSVFGGFVEWKAGTRPDGQDSYAFPLHPGGYWPDLRDLVVLIRGAPAKSVRSAEAMQRTVRTSPYFAQRQRELPLRLRRIRRALRERDAFVLFPQIMEECDSFRRVCETTVPPLDYLAAGSRATIEEIRRINREAARSLAAYTHDAGAHLHVFTHRKDAPRLRRRLAKIPGVERTFLLGAGPGARPR